MRILFAIGKTGGHIFPAIALAEEFRRRDKDTQLLFIGSGEDIAVDILSRQGMNFQPINAHPIKGAGILGKIKAIFSLIGSLGRGEEILAEFKPDAVIGMGGYSSAAMVFCAFHMGIPCFLQEQNFMPGLTNRVLGLFAKTVFTAFENADKYFLTGKTVCAGNPVRSTIKKERSENDYKKFGLEPGKFTLLVFGGSQGAHKINQTMIEAVKFWPNKGSDCQILHQTGAKDTDQVKQAYEEAGIRAAVFPFIDDMSAAYSVADLIVCRAGAVSISEVLNAEKASILIPYPHAANDHQTKNAQYLADRGAALLISERELDGQILAAHIKVFHEDEKSRLKIEREAANMAEPSAAKNIVNYVSGYVKQESKDA